MDSFVRYQDQTTYADLRGDVVAGTGVGLARLATVIKGARIVVDMRLIRSINSVGCREWAKAIGLLAAARRGEFVHCPVAFIDSCNLIPTMLGDKGSSAQIKSYYGHTIATDAAKSSKLLSNSTASELPGVWNYRPVLAVESPPRPRSTPAIT